MTGFPSFNDLKNEWDLKLGSVPMALTINAGAYDGTFDFGGTLQRDGNVNVRSGVSNLTLVIPANVAATVKVSSGLSNVQFPSGWSQNGDTYTQKGTGPALTLIVEMGAGNVQITQ